MKSKMAVRMGVGTALALIAASGALIGEAYAFSASRSLDEAPEITEIQAFRSKAFESDGREVRIIAESLERGEILTVAVSSVQPAACFELYYGRGFVPCVSSCDGSSVNQLSADADLQEVWTHLDRKRVSGEAGHRFEVAGIPLSREAVTQDGKLIRESWTIGNAPFPGSESAPACGADARGTSDTCLDQVASEVLRENFLSRYGATLEQLIAAVRTETTRQKLGTLRDLLRELESELSRTGRTEFSKGGYFYGRTFRLAAPLVCVLRDSRAGTLSPSTEAGLADSVEELERSLRFLKRI